MTAVEVGSDVLLQAELEKSSRRLELLLHRSVTKTRTLRPYLKVLIPAHRKALTRLLLSDHTLAVETLRRGERYRRRVERRDERLCRFCHSAVEDEGHALLVCEGDAELVRLRQELVDNLGVHLPEHSCLLCKQGGDRRRTCIGREKIRDTIIDVSNNIQEAKGIERCPCPYQTLLRILLLT